MKQIPLRAKDGSVREWAMVDDEDYEWLMQWRWSYLAPRERNLIGYAVRTVREGGRYSKVCMHRLVMNAPRGKQVDHRNGDGLDNQRDNLRLCSGAQNIRNRARPSNNTSGYKGVSWFRRYQKWKSYIKVEGSLVFLGYFDRLEDAARAYDAAALEAWGDFSRLNFPAASIEGVA